MPINEIVDNFSPAVRKYSHLSDKMITLISELKNTEISEDSPLSEILKSVLKSTESLMLNPKIQKRKELWIKFAKENGKNLDDLTITNEGVAIKLQSGDLKLGWNHCNELKDFEEVRKNAPSGLQYMELGEFFGNKPEPYLEILGLKNTIQDNSLTVQDNNFNYYGSSNKGRIFFISDEVVIPGFGGNFDDCSAMDFQK